MHNKFVNLNCHLGSTYKVTVRKVTSALFVPHVMEIETLPMAFQISNRPVPTNSGQIYNINILVFTYKKKNKFQIFVQEIQTYSYYPIYIIVI